MLTTERVTTPAQLEEAHTLRLEVFVGEQQVPLAEDAVGGAVRIELSAQTQASGFYERLGYEVHGPVYLDAGIDHRDAAKTLRSHD